MDPRVVVTGVVGSGRGWVWVVWGGVGRGSRDGMDKCSFHVIHLNYIHKLTAGTTCDLYYIGFAGQ